MGEKTLAKMHRERKLAVLDAAKSSSTGEGKSSTYQLMMLKLAEDKRLLKTIESIQRKIEVKRDLLPYYSDWINAVLQHGTGNADNVLMTIMLWRCDVGDFRGALDIARYAFHHNLAMPDAHQRKPATVIAEEIADTAKNMLSNDQPVDVELLKECLELTLPRDMADEVRAKLHRVMGLATEKSELLTDLEFSLEQYREAIRLNEKLGIKMQIRNLEKEIEKRKTAS